MKYVCLLLLLTLQLLSATQDRQFQMALSQLSQITKGNQFGENLQKLIQMKMDQTDKREEVTNSLRQLVKQLEQDYDMLNTLHAKNSARQNDQISTLDQALDGLHAQQRSNNVAIHDLSAELASMIAIYNHLKTQLTTIDGKEEEVRNDRSQNVLEYNKRSGNDVKLIKALEDITDRLTQAIFAQQDRQNKGSLFTQTESQEVVNQLIGQVGKSSPVVMLAQLATTSFDERTVITIIQQLEGLRDAAVVRQDQEQQQEIQSRINYDAVIFSINDARRGLTTDFQSVDALIRRRANERILAERTRDQLTEDVDLTQDVCTSSRTQLDISQAVYLEERQDLENQISLVRKAYQIVLIQSQ